MRRFLAVLLSFIFVSTFVSFSTPDDDSGSLLFYQPCNIARASFAKGSPDPNYINAVSLLDDAASGKSAFHLGYRPLLSYMAPGNIYSQRGTLSFFWRASEPFTPTEFPIFRVGYADHTSWDMCWLRIDYNGHGFDAFVTDVNLARLRVSTDVDPLPAPDKWSHFALTWDENSGIRFYIDGKLAARKDSCVVLNAGLDQFGPHARIISPYQVQSAYNFSRGGDIDEITIFSEALDDAAIKTLASGSLPATEAPVHDMSDSSVREEWLHYYGFDKHSGPYLQDLETSVRKVQLNEVYDIKRWYWKSCDGIRETTWPGVYNRSRIIGRNDYFQLPDWDCYYASGKSVRFLVPDDEEWNCIQINGGAWGTIALSPNAEGSDAKPIASREEALQHSSHSFSSIRKGGTIVFTNEVQETPISEFDLFCVKKGSAPKGIATLSYELGDFHDYANPALLEVKNDVEGRFPEGERQMLLAHGTFVDNSRRSKLDIVYPSTVQEKEAALTQQLPSGQKPIVHIVIPSNTRDLDINVPKTLESQTGEMIDVALHFQGTSSRPCSWVKMQGGLDGIRIELPALDVAPLADGLVPMNIQVKDPIWKLRNMMDFTFSVKPGEKRVLWLDMRDRILPDDKPLYLTIAAAVPDFNASMLKNMKIDLVFKDREQAAIEHVEDRLTQVKDAYAMLCEESATTTRLSKFTQIWEDMNDMLKVDPDNEQGRKYWYIYNPEQVRPGFVLPQAPDGVPQWAFYQLELLRKYREFIEYYIDKRQNEDGEYGGGISDDSDLGNHFAGLVFSGVIPQKATASLSRLLNAVYEQGMLTDGMSTIQTDGLHSYEEGVNVVDQMNLLRQGDPWLVERMMECALAVKTRLIGENAAGHMHFRSDYFSATKMAEDGVWTRSQRREFLHCCPSLLLGELYGNATARADMLRFADDQLKHSRTGTNGRVTIPLELDFKTDEPLMYGVDFASALYWCAERWTGDRKYAALLPSSSYAPVRYDSESLVEQYKETLRSIDLYDYIYKDGSIWIDRVYFPSDLLQRTRLGGIGMNRSSNFVPMNPVIWKFDSDQAAQSVAILVTDVERKSMKIQFFNTSGKEQRVRMTGLELDAGRWSIKAVSSSPAASSSRTVEFGRGRSVELMVPAGQTYCVELKLVGRALDASQFCEVGIGKRDVRVKGGKVHVTVHNIGAKDVKSVEVALVGADGKKISTSSCGPLKAPVDLLPKTAEAVLDVPAGTSLSGAIVVLDPNASLKEIYLSNNRVAFSAE